MSHSDSIEVTKHEKFGWLTVKKPRSKVVRSVAFHGCVCLCGNPEQFLVKHCKLVSGDRVTCGECEEHTPPLVLYNKQIDHRMYNYIARNGPWRVYSRKDHHIIWERAKYDFIPFPHRICRGDKVLIAGTDYIGHVRNINQAGFYIVHILHSHREYKLEKLLLLERPGIKP